MTRPPSEGSSGERLARVESWCESKESIDNERHAGNVVRLDAIYDQVKLTNGRVTSLESWRDKIKGGWWVLVLMGSVVGFIIERFLHGRP